MSHSRHPASIAWFWAAALDGYQVAPYDDAELALLRAKGIFDPEDDPTVVVAAPGTQPRLFFQLVPEGKRELPMTGLATSSEPRRRTSIRHLRGRQPPCEP